MFVKRARVGGHVYVQLMESYWSEGRARQRMVKSLGREDRLDPAEVDRLVVALSRYGNARVVRDGGKAEGGAPRVRLHPGARVGSVWPLEALWSELGLAELLTELASGRRFAFSFPEVIKAIVFGRILHPGSERALIKEWLPRVGLPALEGIELEGIELQHAYRALAHLASVGAELEARLVSVLTGRLFADASLVLFDTTSIYFEGVGPDLASYGYSRDHRPDRRQVNLGLLTSREGVPLAHWLFPGRQSDVRSMALAAQDFRQRLGLGSLVVVADRGMISQANLDALQEDGIDYIVAERLRRKRSHQALSRAGRYRRVTPHLEVKEITVEGAERVILCRNQGRADADRQTRENILAKLESALEEGSWRELLPPGTRRYLRVTGGQPSIDTKRVEQDAKYDGKWVLRTTTTLPTEQVALAYRGLWRVETAFRTLKTPLEIRPVYHSSEPGVRGHLHTCILAYALLRILEDRLDAAGLDLNAKQALEALDSIERAPLDIGQRHLELTTTPNDQQRTILNALHTPIPQT